MDSTATTGIDVTLTAIDGSHLVLESTEDKTQFLWPLDKIPRPLEIGSHLTLNLLKASVPSPASADTLIPARPSRSLPPKETSEKEASMRKLLEELVN
jgi:hypothetical protein